ncbi:MAG: hypothetical protein RLO46_02040 [Pseudomonadales bacterium]
MGGGTSLNDSVGMVFSLTFSHDMARLDVAVLLKGRQPDWQSTQGPPTSRPNRMGAGASVGSHHVIYERHSGLVWIGDALSVPAADTNVLMFDDADRPGQIPRFVQGAGIDPLLGRAPVPGGAMLLLSGVMDQLVPALRGSPSVRAFVGF